MILWRTFQNHSIKFLLKQSENIDHIRVVFHCPGIKHNNTRIKDLFFFNPENVSLQFAKEGDTLIPRRNKFLMPRKFPIPFFEGIRKGDALL